MSNTHDVILDCPASLPSPKEFLFPQKEEMYRYSERETEYLGNRTKRIMFGVRSCDISSISLLDKFFGGAFSDDFYMNRRSSTVFISIACNNPDPTCFCIGLGTGPFLQSGFDIQLTDLGDRYLVRVGSSAGKKIIRGFRYLFVRPKKADVDAHYEAVVNSQSRFEKRVTLDNARQKILAGEVKDTFWESVAERCFECGGCVYECPLCTCFNVVDWKEADDKGVRMKLWDTCMFKGFTRRAGDIIPGEKKSMRTKRWYFHKLLYYPEQFGMFGCVGCGRCTITCPGRIDMASIANKLV
jgi:ferredoxin